MNKEKIKNMRTTNKEGYCIKTIETYGGSNEGNEQVWVNDIGGVNVTEMIDKEGKEKNIYKIIKIRDAI